MYSLSTKLFLKRETLNMSYDNEVDTAELAIFVCEQSQLPLQNENNEKNNNYLNIDNENDQHYLNQQFFYIIPLTFQ